MSALAAPRPLADENSAATSSVAAVDERLFAYLNAYWLRPENALWMTLRSLALPASGPTGPSIDLSCGDGVFSFLHAGGRFDPAFDVFGAVAPLPFRNDSHADMFDHAPAGYSPAIVVRPARWIDIGADLKLSMLHKARALDLYRRLVRHDNNQPLPFADGTFASLYCNSAYWVANIEGLLRELRRISRGDGAILLHVKLADMQRYTLESFRPQLGDRFLDVIGRGRMDCWPTLASRREWERRFTSAGLAIHEEKPFVTRTHAHVWDIGLRPIAPLLVRMANALTPATRLAIKRDWVTLLHELLMPLCRPDFDLFETRSEPAEIQYVLTAR